MLQPYKIQREKDTKTGPLLDGENKPLSLTHTLVQQLPEEYFKPH